MEDIVSVFSLVFSVGSFCFAVFVHTLRQKENDRYCNQTLVIISR